MRKRIESLDFARMVCCLYIIGFWHLKGYFADTALASSLVTNCTRQLTNFVLSLFVFLSGIFAGSVLPGNGGKGITAFLWKKIIRIYPLYIVALLFFWKVNYMTLEQLIYSVCGLGLFNKLVPSSLTLWFICMLTMFYLVTPVIDTTNGKAGKIYIMFIIGTIFLMLNYTLQLDDRVFFYWPSYCAGLLLRGNKETLLTLAKKPMVIISGIAMSTSFLLYCDGERNAQTWIMTPVFILMVIGIGEWITNNSVIKKIVYWGNYICLGAYLFHRIVYYFLNRLMGGFSVLQAMFICLPLCIVVAFTIQQCYDSIIRLFQRKIRGIRDGSD